MARIVIMGTDETTGETWREGWFDPDKADQIDSGTRWDGSNVVSCATGSQWIDETLYRTPAGRWVLNTDRSRYHNGADSYRFVTAEEAQQWAIAAEVDEEIIDR